MASRHWIKNTAVKPPRLILFAMFLSLSCTPIAPSLSASSRWPMFRRFSSAFKRPIHHHISGPYLARYPAEMAWREDHRRKSTGEQLRCVATLALASGKSSSFTGYWQRAA
jgi:hypothetical protein